MANKLKSTTEVHVLPCVLQCIYMCAELLFLLNSENLAFPVCGSPSSVCVS